jgi:hypothetical protein
MPTAFKRIPPGEGPDGFRQPAEPTEEALLNCRCGCVAPARVGNDEDMPSNSDSFAGASAPPIRRGIARRFWAKSHEVDDRTIAALLTYHALIEIRSTARGAHRKPEMSTEQALERISSLSDLVHNLPAVAQPSGTRRPSHPGHVSRRERAMQARPMSYTWNSTGGPGREWMLRHIADARYIWTPPPPLPTPRKGAAGWSFRHYVRLLAGWPVQTPRGRQRLPRQARLLKALDRDQIYALYEEADRERLGLGSASLAFRAHLNPLVPHYIFPDPADYYWPSADRPWWQCRVLLHMVDGEQISSTLAVLPETFTALPSTVSLIRQRRLALAARTLERDYYLWFREHEESCSPERCGYPAEPE